jgi:hypothetical protein
MRSFVLPALLLLSLPSFPAKVLQFRDMAYEPQIAGVQLYPAGPDPRSVMRSPVAKLGIPNLVLEFDDMSDGKADFMVRLMHGNADWTKSALQDLDFLNEYNEFPINDYEFSVDTHIPYVHYRFRVPGVKLPGNYLLVVYRSGDRNDLILSRRFMVYDNQMGLSPDQHFAPNNIVRANSQLINFTVSYKGREIINPMEFVNVTLRQNNRWDNMKAGLKPSFLREDIHELEYRFFDDDKSFLAGNEFRFFDMQSINYPGINVASVNKKIKPYQLFIHDAGRAGPYYSQWRDLDGGFYHSNLDFPDMNMANYAWVTFILDSDKAVDGDVYVVGAFNSWDRTAENLMKYDPAAKAYSATVLLKQGFYNYQYVVDSKAVEPNHFEGNYFQAENVYEILVYYRPFKPNADLLIGYYVVPVNPRG